MLGSEHEEIIFNGQNSKVSVPKNKSVCIFEMFTRCAMGRTTLTSQKQHEFPLFSASKATVNANNLLITRVTMILILSAFYQY